MSQIPNRQTMTRYDATGHLTTAYSTTGRAPAGLAQALLHQRRACVIGLTGLAVWIMTLGAVAQEPEALGPRAPERVPEGLVVASIEVYPPAIELEHALAYRQLVVTGRLETGETVDLTRMSELQAGEQVTVSSTGTVTPVSDGRTELTVRYGDFIQVVPVTVQGASSHPVVSFVQDVQPALSRMACNAGTCHGSKDGKGGFKLSLRGYDPLFDHRALTDDIGARRFNRAAPDQSLMLLKATGSIPHTGGVRTREGERYYELLRQWIFAGARLDLDAPRVTGLEVIPQNPILPRPEMTQQIVVIAEYADGTRRDVTHEAFVESGDIEIAATEEQGRLRLLRRGEAPVLIRYEGAYAATTLTVMGERDGFVWEEPEAFNYIDALVYDKLERMRILPSDLCTDEEFLRRVYLDLTGLPPTPDQVRDFQHDDRPTRIKRDAVVDQLVGSPAFVQHWTNKWADLLQVNRKFLGERGAMALRNWIQDAVAGNMPYDEFAYEILTASGSTLENPPAAYYKVLREPDQIMENTTHLFLAVRFNCNKCHDHPFERWTQDQYYELAAYFAQVGLKPEPSFGNQRIGGTAVEGAKPLVEVVFDRESGEVTHDRTGQITPPAFPYEHDGVEGTDGLPRRHQLARWITSSDNQYFARSYVNRLWGYHFGRGIIEPIDDIRAGNPPTNPELLDALTDDFVESGFDIQHMMRTICKSRTYQLSVATNRWNHDDTINYSHAIPRRLPAEVLYDAIHQATGSRLRIPGLPEGFRAAQVPDAGIKLPFLDDLGRPVRESACECERSTGMVLGPILKLVNGPTVADAIRDPDNVLTRMVNEIENDEQLIDEIWLRFLCRFPTEQERGLAHEALAMAGAEHDALARRLAELEASLPQRAADWAAGQQQPDWHVVEPIELSSTAGATFERQDDGSYLVTGELAKDEYRVIIETPVGGITGLRLEALPDAGLPEGGPGRARNGNFVLNEIRLSGGPVGGEPAAIALQNARADFSQQGWPVGGAIDGNPATGWAVMPKFNERHVAVFETAADIGDESGARLELVLSQQYPDGRHLLGRFRISVTRSPRPLQLPALPADVLAILRVPADDRDEAQNARVLEYYASIDPELSRLRQAVAQSAEQVANRRLIGVQDLAWVLINNPAFLFNR